MRLDYVPLFRIQRELQDVPRGMERFRQYLRTLTSHDGTVELPSLGIANPMAREHVTALLDELLALDVDGIAARAVCEVAERLADEPGDFRMALVIADDLKGGWTNRYATEYQLRFGLAASSTGPRRWLKHLWITGVLWSSEPASGRAAREAALTAVYRVAYLQRHGPARTLRAKLAQEGRVLAQAGCSAPVLDTEDLAYTREVLAPFLEAEDMRTTIECLFGDAAGRTLGFTPRGLSPWAGLALALHDARSEPASQSTSPARGTAAR